MPKKLQLPISFPVNGATTTAVVQQNVNEKKKRLSLCQSKSLIILVPSESFSFSQFSTHFFFPIYLPSPSAFLLACDYSVMDA